MLWSWWPTYLSFCVFGVFFFIIGILLVASGSVWTNVVFGLGIAFLVGGITGLIHTLYLQKELRQTTRHKEMESVGLHMIENGLCKIYPERPLKEIKETIEDAKKHVHIIGSSLKGLVGMEEPSEDEKAIMDLLLDKVEKGISLHILLAHPLIAGYREKMEGREKGWIPVEIVKNLLIMVDHLHRVCKPSTKSWNIRLYMCGPTVFSLEVDDQRLFLEPYPLAGTSMHNFCILCEIPDNLESSLRKFKRLHYDDAWKLPAPGAVTKIQNLNELESIVDELKEADLITNEQEIELKGLLKNKIDLEPDTTVEIV